MNQGSTYKEAAKRGFIWAPKVTKTGRPVFHHLNVSKVRKGDIIFHFEANYIRAISVVRKEPYEANRELGGEEWNNDGWKAETEYHFLNHPLPVQSVMAHVADLDFDYGPISKTGRVNQGYLFQISEESAAYILSKLVDEPAVSELGLDELVPATSGATTTIEFERLLQTLEEDLLSAGMVVSPALVRRLIAAMQSKPFLILTGLAGSGKTRIAQAVARWMTPKSNSTADQNAGPWYSLIPVGADWIGNENVLGYPNGLDPKEYVSRPALELILHATAHRETPHFLILDEMNLSHVERYFADILSAIESREAIPLYEGDNRSAGGNSVPKRLTLPDNLVVIGTVNVDETTYMFSPKVLDRANVIEFRMTEDELGTFLENPTRQGLDRVDGLGAAYGWALVRAAKEQVEVPNAVKDGYNREMSLFFRVLRQHRAEFGYRVAYESARFMHFYERLSPSANTNSDWFAAAFDCVILQKFLPKLHGSRAHLGPLLKKLWLLCVASNMERGPNIQKTLDEAIRSSDPKTEPSDIVPEDAIYGMSAEKTARMWRLLAENGFASFAEA